VALALVALALVVFGAYDSYPTQTISFELEQGGDNILFTAFFFLLSRGFGLMDAILVKRSKRLLVRGEEQWKGDGNASVGN